MNRLRPSLTPLRVSILSLCALAPVAARAGEVLYNGIALPDIWPPKVAELTREPLATPPYLEAPPAVIPIDVGRQLFVDDFLIERTTLQRAFHRPEYHSASPVLVPDKPWEGSGARLRAGCFSDGVWFDPKDQTYKMWYWASAASEKPLTYDTCLATSKDGIKWEKPAFDVVPGTNVVLRDEPNVHRNSSTVWLDHLEQDPAKRFKMFRVVQGEDEGVVGKKQGNRYRVATSPDGIHWTIAGNTDNVGDRSTVFQNPFRNVWVFGIRDGNAVVSRCRSYAEFVEPAPKKSWVGSNRGRGKTLWIGADKLDPDRSDLNLRRPDDRPWDLIPSQLYNLDSVAYESVMIGLFAIWRGQPIDRPKINELCVGYSRDGFHWSRPDRKAFLPVSEKKEDWNWGNVQSAGGCCLVVGDKLHFYVGAVTGKNERWHADPMNVGLATLRRDGFTSMDAGASVGLLTTRPVKFSGKHLFVNVVDPQGELRAEVIDDKGQPIAPFTVENCMPVAGDSTKAAVKWKGADDLSAVSGKPVRIRFHLKNGALYAFWVSPETNGASHGYVAAGGPGFPGGLDTTGK